METIGQGAEATLERDGNLLYKRRTPKTYRHEQLDKSLRESRTRKEQKALTKAKQLGIPVPTLHDAPDKTTIIMEYIDGLRLRDYLLTHPEKKSLLTNIGEWLATLHDNKLIHGDLTTSNILIDKEERMTLIDFGLSFFSTRIEDKAVDIHLFKQALESTHYQEAQTYYNTFLEGYKNSENALAVLERLEQVEARGRNIGKNS